MIAVKPRPCAHAVLLDLHGSAVRLSLTEAEDLAHLLLSDQDAQEIGLALLDAIDAVMIARVASDTANEVARMTDAANTAAKEE